MTPRHANAPFSGGSHLSKPRTERFAISTIRRNSLMQLVLQIIGPISPLPVLQLVSPSRPTARLLPPPPIAAAYPPRSDTTLHPSLKDLLGTVLKRVVPLC